MQSSLRLVITILALASFSCAQEVERFNAGVIGAAVFSKSSTSSSGSLTLKPTNSSAIFGSVRWRLNHLHALEANIGHAMNSQVFTVAPNNFRVSTDIMEFSGDYVLSPMRTKHWDPFLFGGAGALRFSPGTTFINGLQSSFPVSQQTGIAFLYGGGTDYLFWKFFSVRLQYRGLIYKQPNFGQPNLATHAKGHMAEPAVGLVVRF
jgi:Outer membrane protein beta-barrel domain